MKEEVFRITRESSRIFCCWSLLAALTACGGNGDGREKVAGTNLVRADTRIIHEECDVSASGTQQVDVNGDGRADVSIVSAGRVEKCRAVDLNFDGVVDSWVYRDAAGKVRRRESDYDRDGRVDEITVYRGGLLIEKHRATTLMGKLDTWHYYKADRLIRTERDSAGDDIIDQWWEYPKGAKAKCPVIHSDVDGDGRPDPGVTVDVCGEDSGYVPPDRDKDPGKSGPSFQSSMPDDIPTESTSDEAAPPASEEGDE